MTKIINKINEEKTIMKQKTWRAWVALILNKLWNYENV